MTVLAIFSCAPFSLLRVAHIQRLVRQYASEPASEVSQVTETLNPKENEKEQRSSPKRNVFETDRVALTG